MSYLKKIDHEFDTYRWKYICGRSGISLNVDEGNGQKYDACRLSNKVLGKKYNAGVNPLLAIFEKHPVVYNDEYIGTGNVAMAIDENDEFALKKKGFDLDYQAIKETHFIKKIEPILL